MDQAVQLLTDINHLLEEYAPVWYSPTPEKRLRAAIKGLTAWTARCLWNWSTAVRLRPIFVMRKIRDTAWS